MLNWGVVKDCEYTFVSTLLSLSLEVEKLGCPDGRKDGFPSSTRGSLTSATGAAYLLTEKRIASIGSETMRDSTKRTRVMAHG